MRCPFVLRPLALVILVLLSLSARPSRNGPLSGPVLRGPAAGEWELGDSGEVGFVAGTLDSVDGSAAIYAFVGALVDKGPACPACFVGRIEGTLDDGRGSAPDYLVEGFYWGDYPSGEGTFVARILRPGGHLVGTVRGQLEDSSSGDVGSFHGRWRLHP